MNVFLVITIISLSTFLSAMEMPLAKQKVQPAICSKPCKIESLRNLALIAFLKRSTDLGINLSEEQLPLGHDKLAEMIKECRLYWLYLLKHSRPLVIRHDKEVFSAHFNRTGSKLVTASKDMKFRFFNFKTNARNSSMFGEGYREEFCRSEYSSEDKNILLWTDQKIVMLDANRNLKKIIAPILENEDKFLIGSVKCNDQANKIIVVLNQKYGSAFVKVYDTEGKHLKTFRSNALVSGAEFTDNGKLIAISSFDETVKIISTNNWSIIASVQASFGRKNGEAKSVKFNKKGTQIITTAEWSGSKIINAEDGLVVAHIATEDDEEQAFYAEFSDDGTRAVILSFWEDEEIHSNAKIIDAPSGATIVSIKSACPADKISAMDFKHCDFVRFSPDSSKLVIAYGCHEGTARVINVADGKVLAILNHDGPINSVKFDITGLLIATASDDKTVKIWGPVNLTDAQIISIAQLYHFELKDFKSSLMRGIEGTPQLR